MSAAAAATAGRVALRRAGKIVAVGRNYAAHAAELGNEVPKQPILFLKPASSYISEGESIQVPRDAGELHHEVELGVIIGSRAEQVTPQEADAYIAGYVLALDMTARTIQGKAKAKGLPWSESKGYDTFTPVSGFIPKADLPDSDNVELWCNVDGVERQRASTALMLFDVPHLISHISTIFTLEPGDCILTGTPAGVGPVVPGQTITAGITGIVHEMAFSVIEKVYKHPHSPLRARF